MCSQFSSIFEQKIVFKKSLFNENFIKKLDVQWI